MATSTSKYSAALISKYKGLFRSIEKAQWEIGKNLHEDEIVSDEAREELGEQIGRTAKTLRVYYEVYVNFKDRYPEGRPEGLNHGILEELLRVRPAARNEFLDKNSTPMKAQVVSFVDSVLAVKPLKPGVRSKRQTSTENVTVEGVRFKVSDDGETGTVTIFGVSSVDTASKTSAGNWVLEYTK